MALLNCVYVHVHVQHHSYNYCAFAELSSLLAQAKQQAELEQERKAEEKRRAHVRPWDRGKGKLNMS